MNGEVTSPPLRDREQVWDTTCPHALHSDWLLMVLVQSPSLVATKLHSYLHLELQFKVVPLLVKGTEHRPTQKTYVCKPRTAKQIISPHNSKTSGDAVTENTRTPVSTHRL